MLLGVNIGGNSGINVLEISELVNFNCDTCLHEIEYLGIHVGNAWIVKRPQCSWVCKFFSVCSCDYCK